MHLFVMGALVRENALLLVSHLTDIEGMELHFR